MEGERPFTPDTHIAEAGRIIMAARLDTIWAHEAGVLNEADVTAVHETRKAIRRTFTAFKLFAPYFETGVLDGYRRRFKKIMRRLGRCRDAAVFLQKLELFRADSAASLAELEQYWHDRKTSADEQLRQYMGQDKRQKFLAAYAQFTGAPGVGVLAPANPFTPVKVRHLTPILIHQRVAAVRAYEDHLDGVTVAQWHQLRIQCKDLRYALQFFAPLLGEEIDDVITAVEKLQAVLGDLNDARIALQMLAQTAGRETAVAIYRAAQEAEIARLINEFGPLWQEFNTPAWRRNLAAAVAVL